MGNLTVLILIGFVACLSQFGADIYTPSLPAIAQSFNVHVSWVQYTLAVYMIGAAISQLIYGPISEGIGRKKPLIAGLCIYLVGSALAIYSSSISALILARLIQGLGVGANICLWRAIFRDSFKGDEMAKYGSYLGTVTILILPLAPLLGGYFQEYISWRTSFVFLLAYALIALLLVIVFLKETSTGHHLERLKPNHIITNYKELLTSPVFMGYSLCAFVSYGAFFAWFMTGSILIVHHLGYSPVEFAWISFFACGLTISIGGALHGKLVLKFGGHVMLQVGWSMMLLAGILLLIGYLACHLTIWVLIPPIALFFFFSSFIWSNIFTGAFKPFGHIAGNAAALYGAFLIGGGAIFGVLLSHLPTNNQLPLTLVLIISTIAAFAFYRLFAHPREEN